MPNYWYGKRRFPYGKPAITVPIISRLTQGIHYQAHLCRCKTAAALCVTNGGNSSGDGDTSGGNMSDGGGSSDDSNYVEL